MENKQYSIITYIFGDYEFVRDPLEIDDNCEYILVTDNKKLTSKIWHIVPLAEHFDSYSPISKTFYVRYHPFEFASTNQALLLDGSMHIKKSLHKLFTDFTEQKFDCALGSFPFPIKSINELYDYWISYRNYDKQQAIKNKAFYNALRIGIPPIYHETGYMLFQKNEGCLQFLDAVYSSINKISPSPNNLDRLDQPIFNGILYGLFSELKVLPLSREIIQSSYIQYYKHNTMNPLSIDVDKNFIKEMYTL